MSAIDARRARRLALLRAGLLNPGWTGLPRRASGGGSRARKAALAVIRRFGYLQLDTVSVAGGRSHALVLLSRLEGFDPEVAESLLAPGEPLFEYWGHEASWLPIELYPLFAFRRRAFRRHPWWGDVLAEHRRLAESLIGRIRDEGPLRSLDMEGKGGGGWWQLKRAKRVANALWSAGELAIRERRNFQRSYDLPERVIPGALLEREASLEESLEKLLLTALGGHGWASTSTLARTWRLKHLRTEIAAALQRLTERGEILPCALVLDDGRRRPGWIRPGDAELAERSVRLRPRPDRGVLLSPFDPVLWDRPRVAELFGFEQVLEIFKPAAERVYGYYCMPVLAGERLVARYDLKADRRSGTLTVLAEHFEPDRGSRTPSAADHAASISALKRHADSLDLRLVP